jgi:membrane protease YdiL (CAAX protease family)
LKKAEIGALLFAMLFPTASACVYALAFVHDPSSGNPARFAVQMAYGLGKSLQFAFPLVWVWGIERRRVWPVRPTPDGLRVGLAFGLTVSLTGWALYAFLLRDTHFFRDAAALMKNKAFSFGADTPAKYIAFTTFLSFVHSLLEEYYWRWFVYGKLRHHVATWQANVLSSIAFMAYHVVLLFPFFPGRFWSLAMPLSLLIAAGGSVWAWLYERTNSIYAPWLSHLIIDVAIFSIGYDLIFRA